LSFDELSSVNIKHIELIADEMVSNGYLGKISRTGANKRIHNHLHNLANFGVTKTLSTAAK